jgi:3'-phosphoadenosine 5'-phosphosulfate sulfotransferase (PAPS reductase)/FAD synthetase
MENWYEKLSRDYMNEVQPVKQGKWKNTRAEKQTRYFIHELSKQRKSEGKKIPIWEKERHSIEMLKKVLLRHSKPVVSCSFGIDSVVTLYLTRKALSELGKNPSDIPVIWNDTLNEFPEVRIYAKKLQKEWNLNLIITRPKKPLKKIIEDNGGITDDYFTSRKGSRKNGQPLSEKCCNTLKHEPYNRAVKGNGYDLMISGIRADESNQRKLAAFRDGEYFYSVAAWKMFSVRPILWWTEEDIWEYIDQEKIPFNDLYKKNLIQKYPKDTKGIVIKHYAEIGELKLDAEKLMNQQIQTVTRRQAIFLEKIGFKIFTPRTGCMMCPIPIKYGYLKWIRMYYPKVYNAMIFNLGYGKGLLNLVPDDMKEELEFLLGVEWDNDRMEAMLKEILEVKPCVFDFD